MSHHTHAHSPPQKRINESHTRAHTHTHTDTTPINNSGVKMAAEGEYESILCVKPDVSVYRIPPRASNRSYRYRRSGFSARRAGKRGLTALWRRCRMPFDFHRSLPRQAPVEASGFTLGILCNDCFECGSVMSRPGPSDAFAFLVVIIYKSLFVAFLG